MKTIKIIVLTGLLVALYGCGLDHKEWRALTPVDKQMIPYKMGDTIRFIDEKGEQALCRVDRDIIYRDRFADGYSVTIFEINEVRLVSEHGNLSFLVNVAGWRWLNADKYVFVRIESFDGEYRYDLNGSFKDFGDGNTRYFYDSIEINNCVYRHVAMQKARKEEDYWQVYYNTDYGILQVTQNDKNIFTLIP